MIKVHNIKVGLKEIEYEGHWIRLAQARAEVARYNGRGDQGPVEVTAEVASCWYLRVFPLHRVASPCFPKVPRPYETQGRQHSPSHKFAERGPEPEPIGCPPPHLSIDPSVTGFWRVTQSVASRATSKNRDADPGVTSRCEAGLAACIGRLSTDRT